MVGSKRWRVIALLAVVGIALATLVPPAAQQITDRADAQDAADTEERCDRAVDEFLADLAGHIDDVAGMPATELAATVTGEELESLSVSFSRRIELLGCDEERTGERLVAGLDDLGGDGTVAELVAKTVRAAVLGRPPSIPHELDVATTDDLAAVATLAPAGATLALDPGEHHLDEPLLLGQAAALIGAGRDDTTIVSTAAEAAILHLGAGRLELDGLTVAHEGSAAASVVLIERGSYRLRDVTITGGTTDADGVGGAGLVLGPEEHDPSESTPRRPLPITGVEVTGNEGAGIIVRGAERPQISDAALTENGACGICFLEASAGELRDSRIAGNEAGIVVAGDATPHVADSTIEDNRASGIAVENNAGGTFDANTITGNGDLGLVVADEASPELTANELSGNGEAGAAIGGASTPTLGDNEITGSPVGVWVDGEAAPTIEANRMTGGDSAGLIFAEEAAGESTENEIDGFPVGVEVRDDAAPQLRANTVADSEEASIVFRDAGAGAAVGNTCTGDSARIVLIDAAGPSLEANECRVDDLR